MNRNFTAHLSVLTANIIYGANYSIARIVMPEFIRPFGFIILRVGVSGLLFFLAARLIIKEKIERKDIPQFFLCALFGVAINQLLFFKGLSLTSPINAGLIMVTNPIFVLIISGIFLKERITLYRIGGILSGLTGAVLLIRYGQVLRSGQGNPLGDTFILLNSLSYAVYLVMVLPLMKKYHPVTIMQVIFGFGALLVFPFGWIEFSEIPWRQLDTRAWLATGFVVIATTFLAYLLNTMALRRLSANMVSVYIYLQPLFATGFAILLGKDRLHLLHVISAALIFLGVWLTMFNSSSRQLEKKAEA